MYINYCTAVFWSLLSWSDLEVSLALLAKQNRRTQVKKGRKRVRKLSRIPTKFFIMIRFNSVWRAPKRLSEYTTTQHTKSWSKNTTDELKLEKLVGKELENFLGFRPNFLSWLDITVYDEHPRAFGNTQLLSTQRDGQKIQPTNSSWKS